MRKTNRSTHVFKGYIRLPKGYPGNYIKQDFSFRISSNQIHTITIERYRLFGRIALQEITEETETVVWIFGEEEDTDGHV